ncbi:MAG: sigma-70 region 4 domain-containing protein [Actinobacteria bacterium]|nr:sigma-70 region 4 domain-containing protein [Actinomycetota bacterium]
MKIGYIVKRNRLGSKNWTKKELEYLYDNWGYVTVKSIAKTVKRTPIAVVVKAKKVGLKGAYCSGTALSARKVSDMLKIDIHTVTDYWTAKCGLKYRKTVMRFKRKMTLIEYDDLIKWLRKNPDKWDSRRVIKFGLGFEPDWLKEKRILDSYEPKRKKQKYTRLEDSKLSMLYFSEGKSYREIAEIMDRSCNSIEHRLARIRPYKRVKTGV